MVIPSHNDMKMHALLQEMSSCNSGPWLTASDELWDQLMLRRSEVGEIGTTLWMVADASTPQGFIDARPAWRIRNGVFHWAQFEVDNALDYVMVGINLLFDNLTSNRFTQREVCDIKFHTLGVYKVYDNLVLRSKNTKNFW